MATIAPYGTWESPVQAKDTIASLVHFGDLTWDGQSLLWTEMRPEEAGRQVLVRHDEGHTTDATPPPFQARTRVHEYGGGSVVADGGRLTFSNFSDQRLYTVTRTGIDPLTAEPSRPAGVRFADGRFLADGSIVCVRETHPADGEAVNDLVLVGPAGGVRPIATGCDFYASPRPSPDGERLLWLEWDHPNMPWDGTRLRTGTIDGQDEVVTVAGGPDESIFQPEWDGSNSIVFASDRTGWWNLYRFDGVASVSVAEIEADIGDPAWVFGRSSFGFLSSGRVLFGFWEDGVHRLAVVDRDGSIDVLEDELTSHDQLITDGHSRAWFVGTGPETASTIFELDTDRGERQAIRANPTPVPAGFAPAPQTITFPTADGAIAHGIFYPPTNPDHAGPDGESPPLIVTVHGGPTNHAYPRLSPGFA